MSRSSKKGPYTDPKLLKKISKLKPDGKTIIKTWSRDSEISPEMTGFVFAVHNGKDFINVKVAEEMVGHRLGEFSLTRKFIKHGGRMQRELEKTTEGQTAAPGATQPQAQAKTPAEGQPPTKGK